uniref:Cysteine-rich domain-containing protein n=1 Tax=Staphylothermus marinus TaxID=2280 RepID=A0A7C4NMS1_STAMA
MKLMYYPGCTLKKNAIDYEKSSLAVLKKLGFNIEELSKWYCCGATFGLIIDELVKHLGAYRTLVKAQIQSRTSGTRDLLVLCPFCYNVLKRVGKLLAEDAESYHRITKYADDEEPYRFGINVLHFIEVIYSNLDKLTKAINNRIDNVKIAVYYGCSIVRPKNIAVDNAENPTIIEKIIEAIGAEPVNYPLKTDCCGSYQILIDKNIVYSNSNRILESIPRDTDLVVTICPLCYYNLRETTSCFEKKFKHIRIAYLSEVLAYAMGLEEYVSNDILWVFKEKIQ